MHSTTRNIDVLIVIDALAASTSGSLENNIYIIDSNGHLATGPNKKPFFTLCFPGDTVTWRLLPVNPGDDVSITAFSGDMVNQRTCHPHEVTIANSPAWKGSIGYRGIPGDASYSINLKIGNKEMRLNAYLKLSPV